MTPAIERLPDDPKELRRCSSPSARATSAWLRSSRRCSKGALHRIGEDFSERLDIVPAQFRVLVTRHPKYACRACEGAILLCLGVQFMR
jgi:transposase